MFPTDADEKVKISTLRDREVLSRMPDTTVQIIGKGLSPVQDMQGLLLSPNMSIAEAGQFDVLLVPGGYGQQALMHEEEVLHLIGSFLSERFAESAEEAGNIGTKQ
jgi:cyclohexyl-isocyanide hydratase